MDIISILGLTRAIGMKERERERVRGEGKRQEEGRELALVSWKQIMERALVALLWPQITCMKSPPRQGTESGVVDA